MCTNVSEKFAASIFRKVVEAGFSKTFSPNQNRIIDKQRCENLKIAVQNISEICSILYV
jgi:hypothetical protein